MSAVLDLTFDNPLLLRPNPLRLLDFTATDLFAGAGGSSEGLRQAGFQIRICANHWELAIETHTLNHPDAEHRQANLDETDFRSFPTTTVLWASPSCTGHSPAGGRKRLPATEERKRDTDAKIDRATAFAVIRACEIHDYAAVIVENVPEFLEWSLYDWWLDGMRRLGYRVQTAVLNAADFGLAQQRVRVFLVFTRDGGVDLSVPLIEPVHAASIIDFGRPLQPVTRRLYVSPQIEAIPEAGVPYLVTYRKNARPRRADRSPFATVTAGGNHHAVAIVDDNAKAYHRLATHRECARAQGFSDGYHFAGKPGSKEVKRQIGGAVPVAIARFIGERVGEHLTA